MVNAAGQFASDINASKPYWLSLLGTSGNGKTRLARSVWRTFWYVTRFDLQLDVAHQHLYGGRGQFVDWRALCAAIRHGAWGWVDDLCDDNVVILDDIGAEYDRDGAGFTASVLDRILNARRDKWLMLTSNLMLEQIAERIDVRIASRLIRDRNVVVECDAVDYCASR